MRNRSRCRRRGSAQERVEKIATRALAPADATTPRVVTTTTISNKPILRTISLRDHDHHRRSAPQAPSPSLVILLREESTPRPRAVQRIATSRLSDFSTVSVTHRCHYCYGLVAGRWREAGVAGTCACRLRDARFWRRAGRDRLTHVGFASSFRGPAAGRTRWRCPLNGSRPGASQSRATDAPTLGSFRPGDDQIGWLHVRAVPVAVREKQRRVLAWR